MIPEEVLEQALMLVLVSEPVGVLVLEQLPHSIHFFRSLVWSSQMDRIHCYSSCGHLRTPDSQPPQWSVGGSRGCKHHSRRQTSGRLEPDRLHSLHQTQ